MPPSQEGDICTPMSHWGPTDLEGAECASSLRHALNIRTYKMRIQIEVSSLTNYSMSSWFGEHEVVCTGGGRDLADLQQRMHSPPPPPRMSLNGHHGAERPVRGCWGQHGRTLVWDPLCTRHGMCMPCMAPFMKDAWPCDNGHMH